MGQPQSHSTAPAHLAARWQKRQSTARTRDLQPPQRDWQQSLQQHNIITATNNANAEKRKFKFGQNNTKTKTSRNSSCAVFVVVVVLILKPPVRQTILLCHWHYFRCCYDDRVYKIACDIFIATFVVAAYEHATTTTTFQWWICVPFRLLAVII